MAKKIKCHTCLHKIDEYWGEFCCKEDAFETCMKNNSWSQYLPYHSFADAVHVPVSENKAVSYAYRFGIILYLIL